MTDTHDRLTCNGFEVSIKVDDSKSTTYGVEKGQGEEQTSCWISSEADKEFSIVLCRKEYEEYDFTAEVFLDGHRAVYYVYKNETGRTSGPRTISCTRTSPTEVRRFAFGSLELTDDDAYLNMPSAQSIGEIKVLIQRVRTTGVLCGLNPKTFDIPSAGKVPERAKRGLTHRIQYGPAHQRPASHRSYNYERYGRPIAFIFNYRPLQMLWAMGHAPLLYSLPEEQHPNSSLVPLTNATTQNIVQDAVAVKRGHGIDTRDRSKENVGSKTLSEAHIFTARAQTTHNIRSAKEILQTAKKGKTEVKTESTPYFMPT